MYMLTRVLTIVCRTKGSKRYTKVSNMKKNILIRFGEKVRALRIKKGLSQEQLANRAGFHRTYVGMIERAEKNITLENIDKISKALDCKISDLIEE